MNKIDTNFDFRQVSKCGDPDTDSPKLYETHKFLWNRILPNGKTFDLKVKRNSYGGLVLENSLCEILSSDRMCPHFDGKYNNKFDGWLSDIEREELKIKVRTIGGHIIFPALKKDGFTVNQARGVNRKICDRFDLTLECIRRFYNEEQSPLFDTLMKYANFFKLFVDFRGYTSFFMLQDFIDENQQIIFSLPFDDFTRPALPQTTDEYKQYTAHTIALINSRNKRILETY